MIKIDALFTKSLNFLRYLLNLPPPPCMRKLKNIHPCCYLNIVGIHGKVHGTGKAQPQVVDGVDGLVSPDPHEADLLHHLQPPDLDQVGDGDLGQPEVIRGPVAHVDPIRHVQVRSEMYPELDLILW